MCVVHGDGFVATGTKKELTSLRKSLEERYEVKWKIIGHNKDDEKEAI